MTPDEILTACRELISGIEIMEEYPKDGDGHRFWAVTASTWLYPNGAVALIGNMTKLDALKKQLDQQP